MSSLSVDRECKQTEEGITFDFLHVILNVKVVACVTVNEKIRIAHISNFKKTKEIFFCVSNFQLPQGRSNHLLYISNL